MNLNIRGEFNLKNKKGYIFLISTANFLPNS
jgi:hypothetical protein